MRGSGSLLWWSSRWHSPGDALVKLEAGIRLGDRARSPASARDHHPRRVARGRGRTAAGAAAHRYS